MSDTDQANDDSSQAGALKRLSVSATDAIVDNLSSLAGSAVEEVTKRLNEFPLDVCKQHLDLLASQQSIVNASAITLDKGFGGKVTMSKLISNMLKVCITALKGCTWVVCAPTDQGKTLAAQFLIHGKHNVRPTRSLKIDATNMSDPKQK